MKTLILIRHAYALSAAEAGVLSDALRPLSEQGRQKASLTAQRLAGYPVKPSVLLSSPLLRAVQTAEIIGQTLHLPIEQARELNGFLDEEELADFLRRQFDRAETVAAVGHNPNMACLYPLLCGQMQGFAPGSFAVLQSSDTQRWKPLFFGE